MMRKLGLGMLILIVLGGASGYLLRHDLILFVLSRASKSNIGPTEMINWDVGPETAQTDLQDRPPNIIFILADDLGINDISTFGGGVAGGSVPTPNIDRLARSGAIFSHGYSGAASCAPSRAMLMTGRYPTRTGFEFTPVPSGMPRILAMFNNAEDRGPLPKIELNAEGDANKPPPEQQGLPGSEVTIAELLKTAGYHTAHIGKWHLGRGPEFGANAQGFDESLLMAKGLYLPENDPGVVNAKLSFDPIDQFLWATQEHAASFNGGDFFQPDGYITDYYTDEAEKVIHNNRNRPFFLYLAHFGVHSPLQATREDYEAVGDLAPERLRVYAAMVRSLDRSVGRILDKLDEEGLTENTIIVFSSDNGGAGYLGLPGLNAPYRGWKVTMFEGGIRVPYFVSWPAKIAPGTEVDMPVAHIDLMPTLAAAAGAPLPQDREIDGRNILPAAIEGISVRGEEDPLFWQSGDYRVVRRGAWKLQVSSRQDRKWLYDLANDPGEQTNLIDERPDIAGELEVLIGRHAEGARPPLYPFSIASPVLVDKTRADSVTEGDEYIIWQN